MTYYETFKWLGTGLACGIATAAFVGAAAWVGTEILAKADTEWITSNESASAGVIGGFPLGVAATFSLSKKLSNWEMSPASCLTALLCVSFLSFVAGVIGVSALLEFDGNLKYNLEKDTQILAGGISCVLGSAVLFSGVALTFYLSENSNIYHSADSTGLAGRTY